MRAVLLTQRFAPARTVAAVRWSALGDCLITHGVDIDVVCQRYPGDGLGQDDRVALEIARGDVAVQAAPDGTSPAPGGGSPPTGKARAIAIAQRLLALPTGSLSWFRRWRDVVDVLESSGADVVVATSPPHDLHLFAVAAARKVGLPLVLDFRDPFVGDNRYDWPRSPPWRQMTRALERWYIGSADAVITAGADHVEDLRSRYPDRASRIHLVPNGFHPSGTGPSAGVSGDDGDRAPIDIGVVATAPPEELDVIVRGAGVAWPDRHVRLHTFGLPDEVVDRLRRSVEVVATSWIPPSDLGPALDAMHVLLLVLDPSRAAAGGTSTKLYQYLERGRPILAVNPASADVALLGRWATHRILREPSVDDAATALRELAAERAVPDLSGLADLYAWPCLADRVAGVLRAATLAQPESGGAGGHRDETG